MTGMGVFWQMLSNRKWRRRDLLRSLCRLFVVDPAEARREAPLLAAMAVADAAICGSRPGTARIANASRHRARIRGFSRSLPASFGAPAARPKVLRLRQLPRPAARRTARLAARFRHRHAA